MTVALIVNWVAEDGKEDEIAEILRIMRKHTQQEPGCVSYDVFRSPGDPKEFLLVELYRDNDAITAHTHADYFRQYVVERALPALKTRERRLYVRMD